MWCRTLVAAQAIEQGLESRREWLNTNVDGICISNKVFGTCTPRSRTRCGQAIESAPPIGRRTRSMYCSCTVDVERVAEQNRKGHRRCTGRRATIIIFKYHIMSPGIRSCAASLAQAEPARPRNAFAHRSQHEPSTYRYPAVTTLVFAVSFTRHTPHRFTVFHS